MVKKDNNNLLEPVAAVESYFDNLLSEPVEPATPAPRPVAVEERVVRLRGVPSIEALLAEPPPPVPETQPTKQKKTTPEAVAEAASEAPTECEETTLQQDVEESERPEALADEAAESTAEELAEDSNGDPCSRYRFPVQCLMFGVADHSLCIPLLDMGSVAPLDPAALIRIADSPDWLVGILKHRERNLRIVDSAVLLGIERNRPPEDGLHFLVFADEDFAITCERLGEVIYLQDEQVRWVPVSSQGLSMGTVRESLATLLDPARIRRRVAHISAPD